MSEESVSPEKPQAPEASAHIRSISAEGTLSDGVGRRKTSVARVRLTPGAGRFSINGREIKEYFRRPRLVDEVNRPFSVTGTTGRFDCDCAVKGSGLASQAGAVRLAISRALVSWEAEWRPALSTEGLLTRDSRMVERKKYGIRGARRRPQWTKR